MTPRRAALLRGLGGMRALEVGGLLPIVLYGVLQPDAFNLDLVGKYFLLAVLALSVDLVWGYAGLITLGHAVFFGAGGYVAALVLVRQVGGLPASIGLSLALAILVAMVLAGLLGVFLFSGQGVQGGYFALATLAVSFVVEQYLTTSGPLGGYNGIPNLPFLDFGFVDVSYGASFYWFSAGLLMLVYLGLRALLGSRLGLVIRGLREKEQRLNYLGYHTPRLKWVLYTLSAGLAGLVGCVYAIHDGFVSPQLTGVDLSTQAVIWVAVGGAGTLLGAVAGTLLINGASAWLSRLLLQDWLFVLAVVLIVIVRFRPAGLLGAFARPAAPSTQPLGEVGVAVPDTHDAEGAVSAGRGT